MADMQKSGTTFQKVVPLLEKPYHFSPAMAKPRASKAHLRARLPKNSDKKQKNPFALIETASLTVCLYASPCERAHSVSLQPHRQSQKGIQSAQKQKQKKPFILRDG